MPCLRRRHPRRRRRTWLLTGKIRVNVIAPGPIDTAAVAEMPGDEEGLRRDGAVGPLRSTGGDLAALAEFERELIRERVRAGSGTPPSDSIQIRWRCCWARPR